MRNITGTFSIQDELIDVLEWQDGEYVPRDQEEEPAELTNAFEIHRPGVHISIAGDSLSTG